MESQCGGHRLVRVQQTPTVQHVFVRSMSIQKFPLKTIQKIRQYIKACLMVPDAEYTANVYASLDDIPEPDSVDDLSDLFGFGGVLEMDSTASITPHWTLSTVNPAAALVKLPGLQLKPNIHLVSYLFRSEGSGTGIIWAVPESLSSTAQLEQPLATSTALSKIPKPNGALSSFMEGIEGDRTPASFLVASIFRRELQEFGAKGDRINWGHHRLIETVPDSVQWQWVDECPKECFSKVKVTPDGQAIVEFFTCRVVTPVTLYRHLDYYPATSYQPKSLDKSIARAHSEKFAKS